MKFDRSNKFRVCYYGQVNSLRLKLSVTSKWASEHLWGGKIYFAGDGTRLWYATLPSTQPICWLSDYTIVIYAPDHFIYHHQQNKCYPSKGVYLPISKLHSILAVANLLAHNNISHICYCGQISLQSAAVKCSFSNNLIPLGVTFILLAMVPELKGFSKFFFFLYFQSLPL